MQSSINLRTLAALSLAAASEKDRFYLAGVSVDIAADATTYVATNGTILVARRELLVKDAPANTLLGTFIVPTAACQAIKFAAKEKEPRANLTRSDGKLLFTFGSALHLFEPIDGTFPDWRRVIPQASDDKRPAHYNPLLLATLEKIASVLDGTSSKGLDAACRTYLLSNGPTLPAFVKFLSQPDTFGLCHPLMTSKKPIKFELPEWAFLHPRSASDAQADAA